MSTNLASRIEKIKKILDPYNVNVDHFLVQLGIDPDSDTAHDCLNLLEFQDFESVFNVPVPILKKKLAFTTLKGDSVKEEPKSDVEAIVKAIKPISQWSNQELLEAYSKECQTSIQEELAKRSRGRYAIIFNDGGTVDIENSLFMLKKCAYQDTPSVYKLKSGDVREVYRVGDFPMQIFHECPFHSNTLLLDGYCESCGNYWDVNDTERNIFFRLLSRHKKIEAHEIALTYKDMDMKKLISLFPKVHVEYKRLVEEDNLPNLKRRISGPGAGDPFRVIGTNKIF